MNTIQFYRFIAVACLLTMPNLSQAQQTHENLSWEQKMSAPYQLDLKKLQGEEALRQSQQALNPANGQPAAFVANPHAPTTRASIEAEIAYRERRREELLGLAAEWLNAEPTEENLWRAQKYQSALQKNEESISALRTQLDKTAE